MDQVNTLIEAIPDEWLLASRDVETAAEARSVYEKFLSFRLENSDVFVKEAQDARQTLI
jgi:hypothetical protein